MKTTKNFTRENAAIVLIEFQNQWTQPGLYHWLISREMARRGTVENAASLTAVARRSGVPVIHAPLIIDPKNKRGVFAYLTLGLIFRKGSQAAQIDSRVWAESDQIVTGRTAFDAFVDSNLEETMRSCGRAQFFFGGFATDQCVAKTVRTSLSKGFDSYFLSDCCATFASFLHASAERRLSVHVVSTRKIIEVFESGSVA
ncbi:MAG: cysteine hydrolase [Nitrospirae bacterium]|nr:cysteine hydrolase [Nitrospirota bacterium]